MRWSLPETLAADHLETLNSGLRFLLTDLRAARSEFGENRRDAALIALGALMRFIILFQPSSAERLDVPILVLRGALLDLNENIVDPLLAPLDRGPGRLRSSMARQSLKGHIAAAVQRLLQAGTSTTKARRLVANELNKLGVKPERGSGDVTPNTVRHWCDEVEEDVGRIGAAAIAYDMTFTDHETKRFSELPTDQDRQARALNSLAAFVREVILGTQNPTIPPI